MIIERKTIHSYSSEDPNFPARNLLNLVTSKKWKVAAPGENQGFVCFQLEDPMFISGIDIGNEYSAFVEIFVADSKKVPLEFHEILVTSSLMLASESKNNVNPNRVRIFTQNVLAEDLTQKKWDLVKVQCTQPFNKNVQFGLSFVTLHTPTDGIPKVAGPIVKSPPTQFGKFRLKSDSDDDTPAQTQETSVFQKWKDSKMSASKEKTDMKTKLEAMKEAEKHKRRSIQVNSSDEEELQTKKMNRNRVALLYDEEDDLPNEKLEKKLELAAKETELKNRKSSSTARSSSPSKSSSKTSTPASNSQNRSRSPDRNSKKRLSRSPSPKSASKRLKIDSPKSSRNRSNSPPKSSRKTSKSPAKNLQSKSSRNSSKSPAKSARASEKSPARKVIYKPFHKLFDGVVFVISGIQNPERAEMRQKALDMGAKYKQDWGTGCTHLICAFKNTPKYREVKGEGKIVSKNWIAKCHSEKKRLSWRKFALDDSDRENSDSEEEICDEKMKPASKSPEKPRSSKKIIYSSDEDMKIVEKPIPKMSLLSSDDEDMNVVIKTSKPPENGGDKDEIVEKKEDPDKTPELHFGDLTDEEQSILQPHNLEYTQIDNGKKIFDDKTFFLNYDLPATDKIKFERHINYLKGSIVDSIEKADYVITNNVNKVSSEKLAGEIVKSLWIEECYELENWIPTTRYKLSK